MCLSRNKNSVSILRRLRSQLWSVRHLWAYKVRFYKPVLSLTSYDYCTNYRDLRLIQTPSINIPPFDLLVPLSRRTPVYVIEFYRLSPVTSLKLDLVTLDQWSKSFSPVPLLSDSGKTDQIHLLTLTPQTKGITWRYPSQTVCRPYVFYVETVRTEICLYLNDRRIDLIHLYILFMVTVRRAKSENKQ